MRIFIKLVNSKKTFESVIMFKPHLLTITYSSPGGSRVPQLVKTTRIAALLALT